MRYQGALRASTFVVTLATFGGCGNGPTDDDSGTPDHDAAPPGATAEQEPTSADDTCPTYGLIPSRCVVPKLPQDMFMHPEAPTEWWWHTGTLKAADGRTFGFEINAASFTVGAFTQIMLADVKNNKHYKRTTPFLPPFMFDSKTWAESDTTKPWYARLGTQGNYLSAIEVVSAGQGYKTAPTVKVEGGGGLLGEALAVLDKHGGVADVILVDAGWFPYTSAPTIKLEGGGGTGATAKPLYTYVAMSAPVAAHPTQNMSVEARLVDDPTQTVVTFDLTLSQQGPAFFVNGTGINPGSSGTSVTKNNLYFSLTRLQASGSITIGNDPPIPVTGVTWMDHEYGVFGTKTKPGTKQKGPGGWMLQDMQLSNADGEYVGSISNSYLTAEGMPKLNERMASRATVEDADGTMYFLQTFMTPKGRTWTSPRTGETYFMEFLVEIPHPPFNATLTVTSLMDSQEFPLDGMALYEGVASATGTFKGEEVAGTAWNEQEF